ncbi:DUF1367 family protein [Klebsiella quasipneumoniae]|nr:MULTISPECIES: DUF1367 family protein [Klebsiella]
MGGILNADFKQARNPAFHRKFFALLKLGFDYWQSNWCWMSRSRRC